MRQRWRLVAGLRPLLLREVSKWPKSLRRLLLLLMLLRLILILVLLTQRLLFRNTQPRIQLRSHSISSRRQIRRRRERPTTLTTRHPLPARRPLLTRRLPLVRGRRRDNPLRRKDMLMPACNGRRRNRSSSGIGRRDKSEATRIRAARILVLARPSAPIQADRIVARLARFCTILARRLLLAALDLARFAGPAAGATALLGLAGALLLRSRHTDCARAR